MREIEGPNLQEGIAVYESQRCGFIKALDKHRMKYQKDAAGAARGVAEYEAETSDLEFRTIKVLWLFFCFDYAPLFYFFKFPVFFIPFVILNHWRLSQASSARISTPQDYKTFLLSKNTCE